MECKKCGYVLDGLTETCPRCARLGENAVIRGVAQKSNPAASPRTVPWVPVLLGLLVLLAAAGWLFYPSLDLFWYELHATKQVAPDTGDFIYFPSDWSKPTVAEQTAGSSVNPTPEQVKAYENRLYAQSRSPTNVAEWQWLGVNDITKQLTDKSQTLDQHITKLKEAWISRQMHLVGEGTLQGNTTQIRWMRRLTQDNQVYITLYFLDAGRRQWMLMGVIIRPTNLNEQVRKMNYIARSFTPK